MENLNWEDYSDFVQTYNELSERAYATVDIPSHWLLLDYAALVTAIRSHKQNQ